MAAKMKNDPSWISVTELMQQGASEFMQMQMQENPENVSFWLNHMHLRLSHLQIQLQQNDC